ncbi:MAG TPA: hypothetical protein IAA04_05950 [Candidatus Lachnoclostridium pullistercoris]|uniref:Uncharacterized protein n=1 Tax=Candidatus Lachnoclostridium pullistercoris TaxID=2838632 RepID=A0A9D2PCL3_9FIRM|nr:hypothetical protein [Candidatus Lachnoclostridium pullistercoris]
MVTFEESNLKFTFPDSAAAVKYDDTRFYRNYVNQLPGAKGMDFVSLWENSVVFTEVKNCEGEEADNRWRIYPDNEKLTTTASKNNTAGRDSLDIEVARKAALTVAGLYGAYTKKSGCESAAELENLARSLWKKRDITDRSPLLIILFLEGDFGCESRSKKMVMSALENKIKKKLSWLDCQVSVVDSDTYRKEIFSVQK